MNTEIMPELLAPAGSIEALYAAVDAGADAVYIGGQQFGARAYADNPSDAAILEGIEYCHLRGKKVYLTVNTLFKERELYEKLPGFLAPLYQHGIDAVLVQDLGALKFIKEHFPGLPLHASTQMSITTPEGARFLMRHGVCRVVPARELTLSEIKAIAETGIEVETFVHGAMCYSYSGRCLLSSMLGGRSGNRGRCAQPCRLPYLVEPFSPFAPSGRHGKKDSETALTQYPLSMKDLCALDLLPDLVASGVASFKIEGRMKPPQYSAGVSAIYRKYLNLYAEKGKEGYQVDAEDRRMLLDLFDRGGFSSGYYEKSMKNASSMVVMNPPASKSAKTAQLKNEKNQGFLKEKSKVKINGVLRIYPDTPVILKVSAIPCQQDKRYDMAADDGTSVLVTGGIPEKARSNAATADEVARRINKTGGTDFEFEKLDIDLADGLFLPVSMLNELRREALQRLKMEMLSKSERCMGCDCAENPQRLTEQTNKQHSVLRKQRLTILVTRQEQLDAVLSCLKETPEGLQPEKVSSVYLDSQLFGTQAPLQKYCRVLAGKVELLRSYGIQCLFVPPPVLRTQGRSFFMNPDVCTLLSQVDGFLVSSVDELEFLKELYPQHLFVSEDCLYTYNTEAKCLLREEGISRFTLPAELNRRELEEVAGPDSEMLIYGYQPLMQSAQCVRRNTSGCVYNRTESGKYKREKTDSGILYLHDRKHIRFPVLTRCRFCTNTVFNSVPLRLFEYRDQIRQLPVSCLRISFTIETGEETACVLRQCAESLSQPEEFHPAMNASRGTKRYMEGTRGHFKRGVE